MRFTFAIRHSSSSIRYLFLILGLNIPFILYLYSFHGMPNSSVYLRNTFFVKPLSLRTIGTYAQLPPRHPLTKSSPTYDDALIAEHVQKILPLCPSRTVSCLAKTLGASLAVLRKPTDFECRYYSTRHSAHKVVFSDGYGCCTDFVHTFILSSNHLGISARAVHTPGHTTAEFWDPKSRRWIWLDPFLGYQAFDTASAAFGLSHFEIFTNFLAGKKVHFNKISSQLSQSIPDSDFVRQILNPVSYQFILYTPLDSIQRSEKLETFLNKLSLPRSISQLILYLSVKPRLLISGDGQNMFQLGLVRGTMLFLLVNWLACNVFVIRRYLFALKSF